MTTQYSTVKWFDAKKGYGFINHPEGGDDVFIHYSQIDSDDDFKTLRTGQSVQFEMNDGPKGLHAVNVRALDEEESSSETPAASNVNGDTGDIESFETAARPDTQSELGVPPEYGTSDDETSPTL